MSHWVNESIPFWHETTVFPNEFSIIMFSNGHDYRSGWPESYQPTMSEIINELSMSRASYIKINDNKDVSYVNILSGKIIVSCTLFKDSNSLVLNKKNGLTFATNYKKIEFIKYGIRINHDGIFAMDGKKNYFEKYTDASNLKLSNDLLQIAENFSSNKDNQIVSESDIQHTEDDLLKIAELLETLEIYVDKEYEIEDQKARAEKPFVYFSFKPEPIKSTFKYYYRVSLLESDLKRLRELKLKTVQVKKLDDTFIQFEIFDLQPEENSNDIILTTALQADSSIISPSNELISVAIPTLKQVRHKVIEDLKHKNSPNKWLAPLAANVYTSKITIKKPVPEYNEEYPLLDAQRDAVEKGAGSNDYTLVLGPPGTGKTTVILSWVKYFVDLGMKVLVTSQNNKAVDNVLERLAKEKDLECIRVGNESKTSSSIHHLLIENYAINAQLKFISNMDENINSIARSKENIELLLEYLLQSKNQFTKASEIIQSISKYKDNIKTSLEELDKHKAVMKATLEEGNSKKTFWLLKPFIMLINLVTGSKKELQIKTIQSDIRFFEILLEILSEWKTNISTARQNSLYQLLLEYVDVVGATCIGINSNKLFQNIPFDVVIVDESGQIQLHNLMVPLSRAPKAILVGDHKQLPPIEDKELVDDIINQRYDPSFLKKSWFEILWELTPDDHKTMLDTQFRCPANISNFVSKAFYDSKYYAGKGMETKVPILSHFQSTMVFIDTSKIKDNLEQKRHTGERDEISGNITETNIIIKVFSSIIDDLPYLADKNEIGIIIPYANHVLEVKNEIENRGLNIGKLILNDLIASVDSYQGQERDVIIFAFSRSNQVGDVGFLADWRRLNVAMTRTKKQLIMIGNLDTLTKNNGKAHQKEFKDAMSLLKKELSDNNSLIDGNKILEEALAWK